MEVHIHWKCGKLRFVAMVSDLATLSLGGIPGFIGGIRGWSVIGYYVTLLAENIVPRSQQWLKIDLANSPRFTCTVPVE